MARRSLTALPEDEDVILAALACGNEWLADIVLDMWLGATTLSEGTKARLWQAAPEYWPFGRRAAGIVLAWHWIDDTPDDLEPVMASGAALVKASRCADEGRHSDAVSFLAHHDLLVREEAIRGLGVVPAASRPALETALSVPAKQWTCIWCDSVLSVDKQACPRDHSRPDVRMEDAAG
jgi:hypothetical protein